MMNGGARNPSPPRDWANLPIEIIQLIASKITCRFHFIRFRAVCHSWRFSASLNSFTLLPFPKTDLATFVPFTICSLQYPSLTHQPTSSFLVKVSQSSSGDVTFLPPFPSSSNGGMKKTLDLLDCRLVELYKGYDIRSKCYWPVSDRMKELVDEDLGVLMDDFKDGKLKIPRFDDWDDLASESTHYDDIIVYQGMFFAIDSLGNVSWVDHKTMKLVQYFPPVYGRGERKQLIESDEDLYVIDSYFDLGRWRKSEWQDTEIDRVDRSSARVDIKVYKFEQDYAKWVQVETLGDRSFVLGKEYCFSFSTGDVPGSEGDCIYFKEKTAKDYDDRYGKHDMLWIFKMHDRSISMVSNLPDHARLFSPSMNWSLFSSEAQSMSSV